jgi:hypothetical protein
MIEPPLAPDKEGIGDNGTSPTSDELSDDARIPRQTKVDDDTSKYLSLFTFCQVDHVRVWLRDEEVVSTLHDLLRPHANLRRPSRPIPSAPDPRDQHPSQAEG